MKTVPMQHQAHGIELMARRRNFALFCEQGTGKTWMLLANAEALWKRDAIQAVMVVAPKGVHTNWTRREIPTHLEVPHRTATFRAGRKRHLEELKAIYMTSGAMPIFALNIDALSTPKGYALAQEYMAKFRTLLIVDESSRIKNHDTGRTKRTTKLGRGAVARRIATGTPITKAPLDLWAQFNFLHPGVFNCSYREFAATYAELHEGASNLVQHVVKKMPKHQRRHAKPIIVLRNPDGTPRWRNLDRLSKIIEPHTYRVRKSECLDLPDKIYQTAYFELTTQQRKFYNRARDELILELDDDVNMLTTLTAIGKCQQATSGFVMVDGEPREVDPANPRMKLLMEIIEDVEGQFIVWCRFKEEIRAVVKCLSDAGMSLVEYHGDISDSKRELAVDAFQRNEARAFVGQPQSGGIGLTLTAASTAIYYSNDFNLETRLQSEDRNHRIGTTGSVVYVDLIAEDTIDERIVRVLQNKADVAASILGDPRGWR